VRVNPAQVNYTLLLFELVLIVWEQLVRNGWCRFVKNVWVSLEDLVIQSKLPSFMVCREEGVCEVKTDNSNQIFFIEMSFSVFVKNYPKNRF